MKNLPPLKPAIGVALLLTAFTFTQCTLEKVDGCDWTHSCAAGGATGGSENTAGGSANSGAGGSSAESGGTGPASGGTAGIGSPEGGVGGSLPCDDRCTGSTPVCDVESMTCVGCLASTDCGVAAPVCDTTTHTCVECLGAADCKAPTPACEPTTKTCVGCLSKADCAGTKPLCDVTHNACVACLEQTDCTNAAASYCSSTSHTCTPCTSSTQCSNIPGKPICSAGTCVQCTKQSDCTDPGASQCDLSTHTCKPCTTDAHCSNIAGKGVCLDGACVQCTAAKPTACGADSKSGTPLVCDSLKHTCTTALAKSAGLCAPCVSDAQCKAGELCVLDTVGTGASAKAVGYFCHWKKGDSANGAPADCFANGRPYAGTLTGATSIDGQTADVCTLRVSSCIASAEFSTKNCAPTGTPDDSQCGVAAPIDAKCIQATGSSAYSCTMTCGSDLDCRDGFACNTNVSPPVCQF